MKWRRISGATKLLSPIWKMLRIPQNFQNIRQFFFFFKISLLKIKIFKKTDNMLEGNGWLICVQNVKSISSKMDEIWHKTCQKQALFTSFRDFTVIFRILFFDRLWCFKKCFRVIFRVLCENLTQKHVSQLLITKFFCLTFFTWWPDMTLTSIMIIKYSKWCLQMSEPIIHAD